LLAKPHESLSNTIQADWTSLPSQSTALNSGGEIGPNGSATGMRIGALPNAGDALNDYEAEASAEVTVPRSDVLEAGPESRDRARDRCAQAVSPRNRPARRYDRRPQDYR
jgi:hypothetical protein